MMKRAEKFFNNIKIKYKLLLSFTIISFISILIISIAVYYLSTMYLRDQTYKYTNKSIAQINTNIDNNLKSMDDLCILLSYNDDIQFYLDNINSLSILDRYNLEYEIENYLIDLSSIQSFASDITINAKYYDDLIQSNRNAFSSSYNYLEDMLSEIYNHERDKLIFFEGSTDNAGTYSYVRKIRLQSSEEVAGLVSVSRSIDEIKALTEFLEFENESVIKITDQDGKVVYFSKTDGLDEQQKLDYLSHQPRQNSEYTEMIGTDNVMISSYTSQYSQWITTYYIPLESINSKATYIMTVIMWISLTSFVLIIVISLFISTGISRPLASMVKEINMVQQEDLTAQLDYDREDEIGQLAKSFNAMLQRIESLIVSVYQSTINQKDAEMKALQAQINPHFLYNTLESIRTLAVLNDDYDVSEMITAFGQYLRATISSKNMLTTVEKEVEHLNNYMKLMQLKYRHLQYNVEIEEDIKDMPIIKLLLQPLVENSLRHGFGKPELEGSISLTGYVDEGYMYFRVTDTGQGITPKRLKEIYQIMNEDSEDRSTSVGLYNVSHRIKAYYGEIYGITIETNEEGTTMIVKLPFKGTRGDDNA